MAQDEARVKAEAEKPKEPDIKTWPMPIFHAAHLIGLVDKFNELFDQQVEAIKAELKAQYKGFEDMPIKNVLLVPDQQGGWFFITKADYESLLKKQSKAGDIK